MCGYPLIWYVINASKNSLANETWVSTDNQDIKSISVKYGCKVIDRPSHLATNDAKSEGALIHFAKNNKFDILIFIQPTSPLLTSNDINGGLTMMGKYESVFSAYKEHWLPRWSKTLKPIDWKVDNRPMRQEIEDAYVENGAFYITSRTRLIKSGLRYSGKTGVFEMPFSRSFQIDTMDDFAMVEKLLKNR